MTIAAIDITNLSYSWPSRAEPTLEHLTFCVMPKEQIFVSGQSGSGKSTLLALLSGIIVPQSGQVRVLGTDMRALSAAQRDRFRADHIGIIFQQFNLIPYLSIKENILLPCRFSAVRRKRALSQGKAIEDVAKNLLINLDLEPSLWDVPVTQLSIGQQQRVAAARALIGRPEIIIADEPTSALDADRQERFLELVQHECVQADTTLIFVSHDLRLGKRFTRQLALNNAPHSTGKDAAS